MTAPTRLPNRRSVADHAESLATVIQERQLQPGDPFLTTEQAAKHLQVRREVANRALQVLVHRGQIERRQRIGAVVAPPRQGAPRLQQVHFVIQEDHLPDRSSYSDTAQVGIHSALPGCAVDLIRVPSGEAKRVLEPVLKRSLQQPRPEGYCLVRCDYPTQRLVADSGLPAAVHGTPYAGIELPSVDVDGHQMGLLQGKALFGNGSEKIVVLCRDRILPGDRCFLAGLREATRLARAPGDSLEVVGLAPFPEVIQAELELLFASEEKLGIVCTTRELADLAWAAARDSARVLGRDLWIHANSLGKGSARPPFPCLIAREDAEAQGAALGRLLAARLAEPARPAEHRRIHCAFLPAGGKP